LDYLAGEIPEAVRQTKDGVTRVATIVTALKSFAHRDTPEHQPADINRALTDTLTVARAELRAVGAVRTELTPLPPVVCSIGDLNQVFLNLLINAADAIADDPDRGKPHEIAVCSGVDGDDVVVRISDTGVGIPDSLLDRIFEPFFTTKAVGRGSGQGLALARTIVVDGHHGDIQVDSTPGRGTTFTVRIPLISRRPTADADQAVTGSHS
jgi:signal transduction histidine kinase